MSAQNSILSHECSTIKIEQLQCLKYKGNVVYPRYCRSLPEIWPWICEAFGRSIAVEDNCHNTPVKLTYNELYEQFCLFAAGLQAYGLSDFDKISIFSENSSRWLIADQGSLLANATNVVRGSQTPLKELLYILEHSDSKALIVDNYNVLNKFGPALDLYDLKFVVVLWPEEGEEKNFNANTKVLAFDQLIEKGTTSDLRELAHRSDDIATIIYTSGTTGKQKGVMLKHSNFIHQILSFVDPIPITSGQTLLTILPAWHAYERACEYFVLSRGVTMIYSSTKTFKKDLDKYKPDLLIGVPRLFENIYEGFWAKIHNEKPFKQKFVKNLFSLSTRFIKAKRILRKECIQTPAPDVIQTLKAALVYILLLPVHLIADIILYSKVRDACGSQNIKAVSGGGKIRTHLEDFFDVLGLHIHVGYGLTETSPVLTVTTPERSFRGGVGPVVDDTEIMIVDQDSFEPLDFYQKGLVLARGPQVMKGYYKDDQATSNIFFKDGWINTGDLGYFTKYGDLVLTGRAKDLIVLSNGENIEPVPIENCCLMSRFIKQIVVTGCNKALGAIIVPDEESLCAHESSVSQQISDLQEFRMKLIREEINQLINNNSDFRPHERITEFKIVYEPFTIENGLMTQTYKLKRNEIFNKYFQ